MAKVSRFTWFRGVCVGHSWMFGNDFGYNPIVWTIYSIILKSGGRSIAKAERKYQRCRQTFKHETSKVRNIFNNIIIPKGLSWTAKTLSSWKLEKEVEETPKKNGYE